MDTSDQAPADDTSSGASLAISPQATAANICESHGTFCVGAPTIAFEDPVVETPTGRLFQIMPVAGGVNLAFNADPTKCVAVKNATTLVEVRACSQPSAVWSIQTGPDTHSCIFQNQVSKLYLAGSNSAGNQFTVQPKANGSFQQFTTAGICP
jgi:hypothetical protein